MKRPIRQIARSLGALSEKWLKENFPYRRRAIQTLQKKCGYPAAMAREILDDLFSQLTGRKLWALLGSEIGNPQVLDGFQKDRKNKRSVRAFGPKTILHVFAANVPNPSIVSVVLGLLVKSRNIAKVSSDDSGLLKIYTESLKAHDSILAKDISIFSGRGASLEKTLRRSCALIVYGTKQTIDHFSKKVSPEQIFIPYGHRMSFGLYLKGSLSETLAKKTAKDLWLMDRKGCLSPLVIFIQAKGKIFEDFRTALSLELLSLGGRRSGAILESFDSVEQVLGRLKKFLPYLQAVTLEGGELERRKVAAALGELGVNRICRAGSAQKPPLSWHHDGRLNVAPLLRWTDLE